ncbi:tetratricopeptide repeat protein [Streptomyces sp. IF17]|nr:tetratricopeptide repeat protein [Streptomyces alkaliphilus]
MPASLAARGVLAGAGLLLGDPTGAVGADQLARGLDWARTVRTRIKDRRDAQLVLDPVGELTPVFVEDLTEVARDRWSVVVILDVWERIGPGVEEWVRDVVAGERYGELPLNVIAVMAGQSALTPSVWGEMARDVVQISLEPFTDAEATELLARHGVVEESVVATILRLTGGLPVLVDMLAQARPTDPGQVGDPAETAVERFLAGQSDPARREAIAACALPMEIDEDIYRVLLGDDRPEEGCGWLGRLPFVTADGGRYRYHQLVREQMLRLHRTRSPHRWRELHTRLADHHAREREALEVHLTPHGARQWGDERWRAHRTAEIHHLLCAEPDRALPEALADAIQACARGSESLSTWATALHRAGSEGGHRPTLDWAMRLTPRTEGAEGRIAVLGHLTTAPGLPVRERARAHTLRGRQYIGVADHAAARRDFDHAIGLDPDYVWAWNARGETRQLLGEHAAALTDFDRALELEPDNSQAFANRGESRQALGDHALALVDFNRALDLEPDYAGVYISRGQTHDALGNHDAAMADFNRAVDLDPEDAWSYFSRGKSRQALGDHDAAMADFNRAVDLEPENVSYWVFRGHAHQMLGEHADAIADFDRVIGLKPDVAGFRIIRGNSHHVLGDHDAALIDFTRVIELNPGDAESHVIRGAVHGATGDQGAALADLNRAVEIDPENSWAHAARGQIHVNRADWVAAMEDLNRAIRLDPRNAPGYAARGQLYEFLSDRVAAMKDLERAVELDPENAWWWVTRGEIHQLIGDHEAALVDLNRAVRIDSHNIIARIKRGEVHRSLGDPAAAMADLNHAIKVAPKSDPALVARGRTHRILGNHESALTDLCRAIEINPKNGDGYYEMAVTYRVMGQEGEARRWWERARSAFAKSVQRGGMEGIRARACSVPIHCACSRWDEAEREIDFLHDAEMIGVFASPILEELGSLPPEPGTDVRRLEDLREFLRARLRGHIPAG